MNGAAARTLRVVFVTGSAIGGGAERHAIDLADSLQARGHECHAVHVKGADATRGGFGIRRPGTTLGLDARCYLDLRALGRFARHLARLEPGVVIAANPYALMYASLALAGSGVRARLLVTYHSTRLLGIKEHLQMLAYRPFFWHADCAVFVCAQQQRYWQRRAVRARRNCVIHNGVETDEFARTQGVAERARARARYGLNAGDFVIGLCAWLRPEKNHLQLVEAVARLRRLSVPARALMMGEGEQRRAIQDRARDLGVAGDIVITGQLDDVRPGIAACDVMVLCSITETFSLAALEAMAMAKPVIHSDVGGAREMIFPQWNGYLFPAGDTQALVHRLRLLSDPAAARSMGDNARAAAVALFSHRTMVDRYERLLADLDRVRPRRGRARERHATGTVVQRGP